MQEDGTAGRSPLVRSWPLGDSGKYVAPDPGRGLAASVGTPAARRHGQSPGIVYDDSDTVEDVEPEPTAPPPPEAAQPQAAEDEGWDAVSEQHPAAELEEAVDPAAPVEQQVEPDALAEGDAPAAAAQTDVVDDSAGDTHAAAEAVDEAEAPERRQLQQETALQNLGYDADVVAAEAADQRDAAQAQPQADDADVAAAEVADQREAEQAREHVQEQAAPRVATAPPPPAGPPYYLCATAIVKREARYMREWLAFHQLVGVEHFYIYDNESGNDEEPLLTDVLAPHLQQGTVTLYTWPGDRAIADCINLEQPLYALSLARQLGAHVRLTFAMLGFYARRLVDMPGQTDNGPRRRRTTVARRGPTNTRSPRTGRPAAG